MYRPKEKPKPYQYFDTPDGEDIDKKLWYALKPTALAALGVSVVDMMLYSRPKNYMKALSRTAYMSAPFFGVTTAFVLVTNLSAKIRERDDRLNWVLGGASAGAAFGTWAKNSVAGFCGAVFMSVLALIKKNALEAGMPLVSRGTPRKETGVWPVDLTLIGDRPGNWTTGEEKKSWFSLAGLPAEDTTEQENEEEIVDSAPIVVGGEVAAPKEEECVNDKRFLYFVEQDIDDDEDDEDDDEEDDEEED